jgi:biotin operon repressor
MRNRLDTESMVLDAIRAHGTQPFTGAGIAEEVGVCRQTVYKIISRLVAQGHRIEGEPRFGFMARLKEADAALCEQRQAYIESLREAA